MSITVLRMAQSPASFANNFGRTQLEVKEMMFERINTILAKTYTPGGVYIIFDMFEDDNLRDFGEVGGYVLEEVAKDYENAGWKVDYKSDKARITIQSPS